MIHIGPKWNAKFQSGNLNDNNPIATGLSACPRIVGLVQHFYEMCVLRVERLAQLP